MSALDQAISQGAIPSHLQSAPKGTKLHILELGWLECDDAFLVRGANTSAASTRDRSFVNSRRQLIMYGVLINHPHEGLILFETGAGKDYPEVWGPQVADVFARVRYEEEHELKAQIERFGYKIEDVKKVIIGHLHIDHAGGLEAFFGREDVEVWVHDRELRSAFWSVATKADVGVYMGHYLKLDLNWKTFDERTFEFAQGITLHHFPGHTDGLVGMQVNLQDSGAFLFSSDHYHVVENMRDDIPQGWLQRDQQAWFMSSQRVKQLKRTTKCRVIPGHDAGIYLELQKEKPDMTWT